MEESQATQTNETAPTLVRGYTLGLGIVAALFILGAISTYSTADSPTTDESIRWAFILTGRLSLAVAGFCTFVAFLRARHSRFATGATDALNVLLFIYFPIGTGASLYYWLAIRKRERSTTVS